MLVILGLFSHKHLNNRHNINLFISSIVTISSKLFCQKINDYVIYTRHVTNTKIDLHYRTNQISRKGARTATNINLLQFHLMIAFISHIVTVTIIIKLYPSIYKSLLGISSPTKLWSDIVTLPSFRNSLVNTIESTPFNGFWPNLVHS